MFQQIGIGNDKDWERLKKNRLSVQGTWKLLKTTSDYKTKEWFIYFEKRDMKRMCEIEKLEIAASVVERNISR